MDFLANKNLNMTILLVGPYKSGQAAQVGVGQRNATRLINESNMGFESKPHDPVIKAIDLMADLSFEC